MLSRTADHLFWMSRYTERAENSVRLARLSLETGTQPFFVPAHQLYLAHGFEPCGPFGSYTLDPNSRYLTMAL